MKRVSRANLYNEESEDEDIKLDQTLINQMNQKLAQRLPFDINMAEGDNDEIEKEEEKKVLEKDEEEEDLQVFRLFSSVEAKKITVEPTIKVIKRGPEYYLANENENKLQEYESAATKYEDILRESKLPWPNCFYSHKVKVIPYEVPKPKVKLSKAKKLRIKSKAKKVEKINEKRRKELEEKEFDRKRKYQHQFRRMGGNRKF
ncbi:hypothetical protein K502DRAFT_170661 [Neoconidiobolus thromboides FSU 785]|nr:hypothetical protein K502DRAFT_170661 [Neoconidiobolus thromboides FSU 785]